MNRQSGKFLIILLCAAIASNVACTTTTHRFSPSGAALSHRGVANGDMVLVRYANKDDARSSSEQIRITSINESGISGIGENGTAVNAGYDEIFQIEVTKKSFAINSDDPALTDAGKAVGVAIEVVAKAGLVALCITAAAGGVPCL